MRRRAEQVDQTRERITEAAVRLHTTVGPAHTSIAAVADEAGVTRVTVYRHFADLDALFEACTAHWSAHNPRPDSSSWPAILDLEARARLAFGELYRWFEEHAGDLYPINRDAAAIPPRARQARAAASRAIAEALVGREADAVPEADGRLLRAVAGHLVDFSTWRSLAVEQGLGGSEAVMAAVITLLAIAGSAGRAPSIDGHTVERRVTP